MNIFEKKAKKAKQDKKDKNKYKRLLIVLAVFLILLGIAVAFFPYAMSKIFDFRQKQLINGWQLGNAGLADRPDEADPSLFEDDILVDYVFDEDADAFFDYDFALSMMTGILRIPSIDLSQPILKLDTKANLNVGACEVSGTGIFLGRTGNYVLAGHYSTVRGRFFNRLPEIKTGASVFISDGIYSYEYEVTEILHVKAEDTWAVQLNVKECLATLITCDYSVYPYGRVVVKCVLKQIY